MTYLKNRKDPILYIALIFFAAIMIVFIYKDGFLYGSKTDWISQHSVIPDYFRQKFYVTGNLFPDFAMNLGGGQNIYYLSYYGLLSPIILISYLLPTVSMEIYISASSIAIVIISVCLCYRWLRNNGFCCDVSFTSAICFLFAAPLIFHSHRQLMFVNYFPFLLLGLISVDQYYKTHKRWLFILSVFLFIMTSYFFSVGGIVALLIYAGYQYLRSTPVFNLRGFFRELIPLMKGIVIAILMAAVLWLPTLYVIADGRGAGGDSLSILSLLIPNLPFRSLLYDKYSLGLTFISLIALIATLFSYKRNERILSIILLLLLIFPIFIYLLNGTLYVRAKALIPFLPLYILIIAIFLTKFAQVINRSKGINPHWRRAIVWVLFILIIFTSSLNTLRVNSEDKLVTIQEYLDINNPDKIALIQDTLLKDSSFYRMNDLTSSSKTSNQVYSPRYYKTSIYSSTYNKDYNRFFYDILHNSISTRNRVECVSSNNILFQNFMNVKYVVTKENISAGYEKINQKGDYLLYKNENTLPFAFATNRTMNQKDFDVLTFPYNMGALFENIIVSKEKKAINEGNNQSVFNIKKFDLESKSPLIEKKKIMIIREEGGHFHIEAKENASLEIPLNINLKDNILIIRFKVSNDKNLKDVDTSITINEIKNKLSKDLAPYPNGNSNFVYVLSSNKKLERLAVEFSAGKYEVFDFEAYILPAAAVRKAIIKMDSFIIDAKNTSDNQIEGDIQVENDGYFATTLPFDKGFDITVDGETQSYEKVNTTFVGFPIEEGNHHIVIKYHAPYKKAGMVLSVFGFFLFALYFMIDQKRIFFRKHANNMEGRNDI